MANDLRGFPYRGLGSSGGSSSGGFVLDPSLLFGAGEPGYWLDPSDMSTLFQDAAGTVPVTAHGDPIGRILDKSGNGYIFEVLSGVAGNRPLFDIDANGYKSINFVSTDTLKSTTTVNFTSSNKHFIGAGFYRANGGTGRILLEGGYGGVGGMNLYAPVGNDQSVGFPCTGSANGYKNMGMYGDEKVVATTTWDMSIASIATAVVSRLNGRTTGYTIGGSSAGAACANGNNVSHYIGSSNGAIPFLGRLYGLVVRGALTSTDQVKGIEEYMNSKMALW